MINTLNKKSSFLFFLIFFAAFAAGCATTNVKDDPLQFTKKLVQEGHVSLYENGAFQVPNTSISLIPPGPSAIEFAGEVMGMRAKQSFETSIKRAAESVSVVSEGTKLTCTFSKNISAETNKAADDIRKMSRENSKLLVYKSSDLGKSIIGKSWEVSKQTFRAGKRAGDAVIAGGVGAASAIDRSGTELGTGLAAGSASAAKDISSSSLDRSGRAFRLAGNAFVKGYAAVPSKMKRRTASLGENLSDAKFASIVKETNAARKETSQKAVDLMTDTVKNYGADVSGTFGKAGKELSSASYSTTGLSLAVLKSLRWVLQGLLWDATIEPAVKMTGASLGYIGVNLVAFPSMVVIREGVATTKLAVEVTWDAAKIGYDLVAPTGVAAVAGVYGVADLAASHAAAGTSAVAGTVLGYSEAALSKTAAVLVKGGAYGAGKTVQYVGVPLASAGIAVTGGTIGTAVGGVGAVSGGALFVTGETAAAGTQVFGNVIAGTTLAAGTVASTAGGAAYGVYELSKAFVVPAGYELGGGIVLSYGTLSHIAAHSILAVSDCAYLVLSLEGPRWVIYAVKGKTGDGDDLPVGAVVDLKNMQESGEEILYLPVSDEEMKNVVHSVYDNLPEIKYGEKVN